MTVGRPGWTRPISVTRTRQGAAHVTDPDKVPPPDRQRTIAHLSATVATSLQHCQRHLAGAQDAATPESFKFNLHHLHSHLDEASDHLNRLQDALVQWHPAIGAELGKLREAGPDAYEPPEAPIRGADAFRFILEHRYRDDD